MPGAEALSDEELMAIAGVESPAASLSDEELMQAAGVAPEPAPVAPRPIPMDPPFLESQPYEPGGPIERQQGGPALAAALPFMLPPGESMGQAAAIGAGYQGVRTLAQSVKKYGWDSIKPENLRAIGKDMAGDMAVGAVTGAVGYKIGEAIAGRPQPLRRDAEEVLRTADGLPPLPVGEEGQRAYARRVDDILTATIPKVAQEDTAAAYNVFKDTVRSSRPTDAIDVTKYNQTLQRYANKVLPDLGIRVDASSALKPIGESIESAPSLAAGPLPFGEYRPAIPPGPTRSYATVEEVLAREQGLGYLAGLRNPDGGSPTVPGGVMSQIFKDTKAALYDSLTPAEQAAYSAARATAKQAAQARAASELLQKTLIAGEAGTNARAVETALRNGKSRYTDEFGPALYDQMYTIAKAGQVLEKLPRGRVVMAQVLARLPGAAVGGAAGQVAGNTWGGEGRLGSLGGAMTGFALSGGVYHLVAPEILRSLEAIARERVGTLAMTEAIGRLGVSLAMEDQPEEKPAAALPIPTPSPTPLPLGRVGAP